MRIVIDIDGTICPIKEKEQSYADLIPHKDAVDKLKEMRASGHYIILQTARNMATCESNVGKVMKNIGKITLDWLEKHDIVYDEIFFGKPNAEIYIDDRAFRYESWDKISEEMLQTIRKSK